MWDMHGDLEGPSPSAGAWDSAGTHSGSGPASYSVPAPQQATMDTGVWAKIPLEVLSNSITNSWIIARKFDWHNVNRKMRSCFKPLQ